MSDGKTVNLRVSKALPTDVGRGRARISGGTDLDLKPGDVVEIIGGNLKKTIMVGDSEVDANSAYNANLPFVLVKDGYTEKSEKEIKHDELISNFIGFEKIIEKYL